MVNHSFGIGLNRDAADTVLDFYYLTSKLKDIPKMTDDVTGTSITGRQESVADHVFGTCMYAIGLYSQYDLRFNLDKVLLMLVLHELDKVAITVVEMNLDTGKEETKYYSPLSFLQEGQFYQSIIDEYNAAESYDSKIAHICDNFDNNNSKIASMSEDEVPRTDAVLTFYYKTLKLKSLIRTGWKQWNVKRDRLESVAEHIFGTMMLAIAMKSEYKIDVDISEAIFMLAMHETEEIVIGDITPYQGISREKKMEMGKRALKIVLEPLIQYKQFLRMLEEFNNKSSILADFAYMCDKLECDLMALFYDKKLTCSFDKACSEVRSDPDLRNLEVDGASTMADFFYLVDCNKFEGPFKQVLDRKFCMLPPN